MGCGASAENKCESLSLEINTFEKITIKKTHPRDEYKMHTKALGTGGFGTVLKAEHKKEKCLRAIKQIAKKNTDPKAFNTELSVSVMLDHPNITKLFDVFEDRYFYYLVMELCSGGELFDAIVAKEFFNEKQASCVMIQALSGINYMHKKNIAHRDIKAENFLLSTKVDNIQEATIKIVDFGLAYHYQEGEKLTMCMGTAMYVAPQVLEMSYSHKCDIWSLGVLLYIMLSGEPPFQGRSNSEMLMKVQEGKLFFRPQYWEKVSLAAQDLVRKLLTYDEKDRISAEGALNDRWIKNWKELPETNFAASHLSSLTSFIGQNKLKRAALQIIARRLNEKDVKELKEAFQSLDKNNDGVVTYQELQKGMENLNDPNLKDIIPSLQELIGKLDSNGTATLDYSEFLAATLKYSSYQEDRVLWGAFCIFDKDQNETICRKELAEVLNDAEVKDFMGTSCVETVLKECDTSGDGVISFQEFKKMMLAGEVNSKAEAMPATAVTAAA